MDKLLNAAQQLNWVDVFCLIALFRIGYIGVSKGLAAEFFKLLGTLAAVYLSLHYYTALANFIGGQAWFNKVPPLFLNLFSVIILAIFGYLVFKFLRLLFLRFIQLEPLPGINKWGGLILGIARGFLLTSLIIFMFVISPWAYFKTSVRNSAVGKHVLTVSPATYTWFWNNIMSKFMTCEKFNVVVPKVQSALESKTKK